jgi:hypothetical protein
MMTPDPITTVLDQIAAHHEQITQLEDREASHHAAITERLTQITDLIAPIGQAVHEHAAILSRIESLDGQATDMAADLTGTGPDGKEPGRYRPGPAPRWWKLSPAERQEPITRLRAWVEQVYRPGYGHLAATLGPCWDQHDLCLYALDILADLWSVLYLQPSRSPGMLSAQAEYQARILPALAGQLQAETMRCGHPRSRPPVPGQAWSVP